MRGGSGVNGRRSGTPSLADKVLGRNLKAGLEGAGKIKWIGKAHLGGDFLDEQTRVEQALGGAIHFQAEEVAKGRLVIEALKEAA